MDALEQVRDGLNRAWDSLAEGWRDLRDRAADALTRFHVPVGREKVETRSERVARSGARWGFLAAEINDGDDAIEVNLEVPGMEPGDFDVHIKDDVLIVRGEKHVARDSQQGQYHLMQRAYGRFERTLRLPALVDDGKAKATYKRGVLHLSLPKISASRSRRIPISS